MVIKNGEGKIIANDELWSGKLTGLNECTFPFYITSVPDTDFYEIEVGRRGSLVFSRSDLELDDWQVGFQIGDR